jgi:hypothetical protein
VLKIPEVTEINGAKGAVTLSILGISSILGTFFNSADF